MQIAKTAHEFDTKTFSIALQVLDVRPAWEFDNGHISNSIHVLLFIEDTATDPMSLLKKWVVLGYGGAWQGNRLTKENDDFVSQVVYDSILMATLLTVGL